MNVELELLNHPKYGRLKKRVGGDALEYLIRLWGHCGTNKRGEHWPNADAEYVEAVCQWPNDTGALFQALVECRFIDLPTPAGGTGVIIHDWNEQNSFTVDNWNRNPSGKRKNRPAYPAATPRATPRGSPPAPDANGLNSPPDGGAPLGHPLRVSEESEKSEESEGAPPPAVSEIPSEAEFLGAFMADGIPEDYLRSKFAWFAGNNAWLDRNGRLKHWRILVRSWWSDDRARWTPGRTAAAPAEGVWSLEKKIAAQEEAIRRHPANIMGSCPAAQPTAAQEEELKKMRAAVAELKRRLAA